MNQLNDIVILSQKILSTLGAVIYAIFALIIVKQTTSMARHIVDKFNSTLIIFSYIHLIFAVLLVILTLILL
ncbi:MAG: DUF5657 family protein [Patescibacteria group bacterium]|jgi:hypothetical protein